MAEGVYLYCIAPPGHRPPAGLRGLEEREVRAIEAHGLGLWISELPEAPRPSVDRIRAHDRVVRASMTTSVTPLPTRFGHWFPSRDRLEREVAPRAERHRRALGSLAGRREFGVRVVEPDGAEAAEVSGPARSGRDYLERLARRRDGAREAEERGREVAAALASRLDGLTGGERVEPLDPGEGLVSIAHLVSLTDVDAYRERVSEFGRRGDGLRVVVTGPWPPYSFPDGGGSDGEDPAE